MQWTEFENTRANGPTGRVNDIAVVGEQRWAVSSDGRLFSWQAGAEPTPTALPGQQHARCVAFDSGGRIGWVGLLLPKPPTGGNLTRLLKTTDGGANWVPVGNLPADPAEGVCGISVVHPTLAFACGTYNAATPGVWQTRDGTNWSSLGLPGGVSGLTDIKFWNATDGIVIGKKKDSAQRTSPLILLTNDAGVTWQTAAVPDDLQDGAHCWKVHRCNVHLFYVTVAGTGAHGVVLKSTDGGRNWQALQVSDSTATVVDWQLQGIEFINPTRGWVGQHGGPAFETTDGGQSWQPADPTLVNLNRFAVTSEGLYATGDSIYLGSVPRRRPPGSHYNSSTSKV